MSMCGELENLEHEREQLIKALFKIEQKIDILTKLIKEKDEY